jgi:hypothetical protein
MVAMHGREDPLLDAGRFPRLLRQANDAEVADVRKVGDDDYEIAPHRTGAFSPVPPPAPQEATEEPVEVGVGAGQPAPTAGRENGQIRGLRFRRGSRAPLRGGEIPLIGVVQIEPPPVESTAGAEAPPAEPAATKPARPRRPARKKAASKAAEAPADAVAPKRPRRPRAKKKAE